MVESRSVEAQGSRKEARGLELLVNMRKKPVQSALSKSPLGCLWSTKSTRPVVAKRLVKVSFGEPDGAAQLTYLVLPTATAHPIVEGEIFHNC